MKRIVLHIDRLVLRGFDSADGDRLAEGLRQELGALLATAETAQAMTAWQSTPRLHAGTVHIDHGAPPVQVGQRIAGVIIPGGRT
jgi:hypothetical protein